ncbi:MAG: aminoacyl-tRNA hydrolase [Deltaproteobacteria bacterium]|jgi:ribosome-associated protein|nr:aminoacyl-tRNA hydrolase [Deltaproteobacteria bacterium]MBW2535013.1 aminoacyl-tRNA hydrolase [Deltaproteobacteria bacterium]
MPSDLHIRGALVIPGDDLSWRAVRSSGPGGQNVNKVSTKVELRFDLAGTRALPGPVKARLRRLARGRIDADGRVLITSQLTRNRVQNLQDARSKLADLIRRALVAPKRRRPTRRTRASERRRLDDKRRQSDKKQRRQKLGPGDRG